MGRRAKHSVEEARRHAAPWIERAGRAGLVSKGVVNVAVGVIALGAAFGDHGEAKGPPAVFALIRGEPLGAAFLALLVLGLVGYAMWQLLRVFAARDERSHRDGRWPRGERWHRAQDVARRAGWAIVACVYGGLAVAAARAIGERPAPGDEAAPREWTATALAEPFGQAIVVGVALGLLIAGGWQVWKALHGRVDPGYGEGALTPRARRWIAMLGRFGFLARGLVTALVALFVAVAGIRADPAEARGLGGALRALERQPYGPWLLAAAGLGFLGYGVYVLVAALNARLSVDAPATPPGT